MASGIQGAYLPDDHVRQQALPRVVVAGHLCLDLIPDLGMVAEEQFRQLFRPGHLVVGGPMTFATGGAASNTGQALARLGLPVRIIAKVGEDPFAEIVRGVIRRNFPGLEEGLIVTPDAPTSYTVIISAPGVDRSFLHCTGANDTFVADDVDPRALEGAALFHFGYPPLLREFYCHGDGGQLAELFRRARQAGALTSLDLTLPDPASPAGQADWSAILAQALPYVDIFLPSLEETLFMLRRQAYDELQAAAGRRSMLALATPELLHSLSSQLIEMGVKIAGIKLGERGMYLRTAGADALAQLGRWVNPVAWADQTLWAPAYRVEVAGTTGAGDAAIAGFLSGLLRGLGPREALQTAVAVGACNVEAPDALSGLLDWEATLARARGDWMQHPLELTEAGWDHDKVTGVWAAR